MNGASWGAKAELALVTGIIAAIISAVTGWHFAFIWYLTAIATVVLACIGWAALEIWKDYRRKRN